METETINTMINAAESIGTIAILLMWLNVERQRSTTVLELIVEDWKRQRERERDKDEEK